MNKKNFSFGLLVLILCGFGTMNAQTAVKHKKIVSPEEQLLADLDVLHQADLNYQDLINTDEYRKSQRSLLVTEHHALPTVAQEPQHLALEQRHDEFINKYTVRVDQMRGQLQSHADTEKAIRTKQMKLADAVAAVKQWKSESDATLSLLNSFNDEFAQIGQDYLDIFQDHHKAPPSEADHLIKPPGTMH